MTYNPLFLEPAGESIIGDAGVTSFSFATNPGPNNRVYLYADMFHNDSTDRLCTIFLNTDLAAGTVVVAEPRTIGSTVPDRVFLARPVIVRPNWNLAGFSDAIATASTLRGRAVYIEVPQGQSLAPFP